MKKGINLAEEIKRREYYNSLAPFPVFDTEVIEDMKKKNRMVTRKDDYNNVPVSYCKTCLSISIKNIKSPELAEGYCASCGNTDIETAHVEEWEELIVLVLVLLYSILCFVVLSSSIARQMNMHRCKYSITLSICLPEAVQ